MNFLYRKSRVLINGVACTLDNDQSFCRIWTILCLNYSYANSSVWLHSVINDIEIYWGGHRNWFSQSVLVFNYVYRLMIRWQFYNFSCRYLLIWKIQIWLMNVKLYTETSSCSCDGKAIFPRNWSSRPVNPSSYFF